MPERTLTVPASTGLEVRATPVALEVTQRVIAHQHDVASVPTVTPVGTTPRHVSFAAEAEASIAPATGADEYPRAIEHAPIVEERGALLAAGVAPPDSRRLRLPLLRRRLTAGGSHCRCCGAA
jgi:hypothetical protein